MDKYTKLREALIKEHSELIRRITNLDNNIFEATSKGVKDIEEYALKNIQVTAMKTYADCLEVRLVKLGVEFNGVDYSCKVASIMYDNPPMPTAGADYDANKENMPSPVERNDAPNSTCKDE